jgi:hypothetical protein
MWPDNETDRDLLNFTLVADHRRNRRTGRRPAHLHRDCRCAWRCKSSMIRLLHRCVAQSASRRENLFSYSSTHVTRWDMTARDLFVFLPLSYLHPVRDPEPVSKPIFWYRRNRTTTELMIQRFTGSRLRPFDTLSQQPAQKPISRGSRKCLIPGA